MLQLILVAVGLGLSIFAYARLAREHARLASDYDGLVRLANSLVAVSRERQRLVARANDYAARVRRGKKQTSDKKQTPCSA